MEAKNISRNIRVRIAPSPTGFLHVGTARAALFNFLFARKNGGTFIVRIEDTDKERSRKEWEIDITENLKWLGLDWDEFARQSERAPIHRAYLEKLLETRRAYYCFCTTEELEAQKQSQLAAGQAPRYLGTCRNLEPQEAQKRIAQRAVAIIRFASEHKIVQFHDLIRGKIEFDISLLGDFVIAKNLDTPLYNFSAAIDDHDMQITHVIRGEDHIPNTPKQILIQEA